MALVPPKPHDIALTLIVTRLFPPREISSTDLEQWHVKNAKYLRRMLHLLARECMMASEPSGYGTLMKEVEKYMELAPNKHDKWVKGPLEELRDLPKTFADIQESYIKMEGIAELYIERSDEGPTSSHRVSFQSPIGVFARKVYLAYKVLGFMECHEVGEAMINWCAETKGGDLAHEGLEPESGGADGATQKRRNIKPRRRPGLDDTIDVRLNAFQTFQSASQRGDYSLALHSLGAFFNYRFPPSSKKMHQHALLNLASFKYATGGLENALECVDEAIKIARAEGDKECLSHCMSLHKRLVAETQPSTTSLLTPGLPPHISDVCQDTKDQTPLDEFWAIKHRLDLGESVPAAYNRIYRAIGRDEAILDAQRAETAGVPLKEGFEVVTKAPVSTMLQPGLVHGVQSTMWELLGSKHLAELHEDIVFQSPPSLRDIDLNVTITRSQRLARSCKTEEAITLLLEPDVTEGLSLVESHKWSQAVWDVLEIDARHREDDTLLQFIHSRRLPDHAYRQLGPGAPTRVLAHTDQPVTFDFFGRDEDSGPRRTSDWVNGRLRDVIDLQTDGPDTQAALPLLLSVLHTTATLQMWPTFRKATIMLAELMSNIDGDLSLGQASNDNELTLSMIHLAAREVMTVWDQVMRSEDHELIYTGAYVISRAYLTRPSPSPHDRVTEQFAAIALQAARKLKSRTRMREIAMLNALIADVKINKGGATVDSDNRNKDAWASCWMDLDEGKDLEETLRTYGFGGKADSGPLRKSTPSFLDIAHAVDEIIVRLQVKAARE